MSAAGLGLGLGLGLGFVPALSPPGGFDYYVASTGNDSNDGLSPSTAFATPEKAASVVSSGDSVGFHSGDTFRGEFDVGSGTTDITVGIYGGTARAILNAADILSSDGWTTVGDGSYSRAVTLPAGGNGFVNAWEDGTFLALAANQAACASTPGTYFPSAHTGSITLYIHPSTGAPATNGKVYEVTVRNYAVNLAGDNGWIEGIHGKNNYYNDGSLVVGKSGTIKDCKAENGGKHNMFGGDGATIDGCEVLDSAYNGFGNLLVFFTGAATGLPLTIKNTSIVQVTALPSGGSQTAVYHHAVSGTFGLFTLESVTIDGGGILTTGLAGDNGTSALVQGGLIKNCNYGSSYSSDVILDAAQIVVNQVMVGGTHGVQANSNTTVTLRNGTKICVSGLNAGSACLVYNGNNSAFVVSDCFLKGNQTGDYQNTIIFSPSDSTGMEITFDRNQIGSNDFFIGNVAAIGLGVNPVTINSWNNNHYETKCARSWNVNGTVSGNFAAWQARGYDADGAVDGDASSACVLP